MLQTRQDVLDARFKLQRAAFEEQPFPALHVRKDRLKRLLALTERHEAEICAAIDADFGGRSAQETRLAELFVVRAGIRHALAHLPGWMRERRVATSLPFLPGRNRLLPQPVGVVGVVSPWNYPFQLAIAPATAALAAGNRVLLKPSELTPRFPRCSTELVGEHFAPDEMSVVNGDAEVGKAFVVDAFRSSAVHGLDCRWPPGRDGSGRQSDAGDARAWRQVAGHLRRVLRSRCVRASVAYGKLLNAGQTCIAPDYLLVPLGQAAYGCRKACRCDGTSLSDACATIPTIPPSSASGTIGVCGDMIAEARENGADVIEVDPAGEKLGVTDRKMAPTLVMNASNDLRLMREEIFGPVLPIIEYAAIDDAIDHVNRARASAGALLVRARSRQSPDGCCAKQSPAALRSTTACCTSVQESQPFGGVGASGMGAYHGEWGFRTFSKEKPIFIQSRLSAGGLLRPPYGKTFERALRLLGLMT